MLEAKIEAYFADKLPILTEAVCRLIRIPSVKGKPLPDKPFGEAPAQALAEALSLCAEWGMSGENLENYVGTVDLNQKDTELHILAHLDVVPAGTDWTVTEAFSPKVVGDLLYGRGSSDDKGPAVAALLAMKAVKDMGIPLQKNVRMILGTDEEDGFHDIDWYYDRHPYAPHTFSPDASFPIINLEKGHLQPHLSKSFGDESGLPRVCTLQTDNPVNMVPPVAHASVVGVPLEILEEQVAELTPVLAVRFALQAEGDTVSITCHGRASHASTPEEGNNALTALISLLTTLPLAVCDSTQTLHFLAKHFPHNDHTGEALGIAQSDDLSGALSLTLSVMDWREGQMLARFDARTPLCATEDSTLGIAQRVLENGNITTQGRLTSAHYVPNDSPFIETLLASYELYTGRKGECLSMGGGTYVHDIPGGVAFGAGMPEFVSHLHEADECVSLSELLTAAKIFTHAIVKLCG